MNNSINEELTAEIENLKNLSVALDDLHDDIYRFGASDLVDLRKSIRKTWKSNGADRSDNLYEIKKGLNKIAMMYQSPDIYDALSTDIFDQKVDSTNAFSGQQVFYNMERKVKQLKKYIDEVRKSLDQIMHYTTE